MPIVTFHLVEQRHDDATIARLLIDASHLYSEILSSPMERVRAFVSFSAPQHWAVAGKLVADGQDEAPYFTCLALAGRPVEQHHALLRGFTDLVVQHLGCRRDLVRGQVIPIDPDNWAIGGEPASFMRAAEVAARAAAGAG